MISANDHHLLLMLLKRKTKLNVLLPLAAYIDNDDSRSHMIERVQCDDVELNVVVRLLCYRFLNNVISTPFQKHGFINHGWLFRANFYALLFIWRRKVFLHGRGGGKDCGIRSL